MRIPWPSRAAWGVVYKFRQEIDPERIKVISRHLDADMEQALSAKRKAFSLRFFWVVLSVPVVGFAIFFCIGMKRGEI